MKRLTALILATVICLGLLVSCNNEEAPTHSESSETESQSSAAPVEDARTVSLMSDVTPSKVSGKETDEAFISSQTKLSLDLFKASSSKTENKNVLISPLSVQLALTMMANGAGGETRAEMENVLADNISVEELNEYLYTYTSELPSDESCKLQIANSIWLKDTDGFSVKDSFLQTNANYYRAEIYKSAFNSQTVNDINGWVYDNTDGMIERVINEIEADTVAYLLNAIAFDAEWKKPISEYSVYDSTFTNIDGDEKDVKMMRSDESTYLSDGKATGFKKDYKGGKYSFVALLPNEGVDINDYIESLNAQGVLDVLNNARESKGNVRIPKFGYEYGLLMNEMLGELGMPLAFSEEQADFSAMTDEELYIDKAFHKTVISVDNLGTKAGAATVLDATNSLPTYEWSVTLDRPFVYMIIDNTTNLPIFIGAAMDI